MDCGVSTFHPTGETSKIAKAVTTQGIEQLFTNEFHGFRSYSIYIHEIVFFSIVILATALKDLCFGESRKEHPIAALVIGGSVIIILIILSGLFALVLVSEVAPNAIELNTVLLLPVSVGICIPSVIMGAVVERMEDAL